MDKRRGKKNPIWFAFTVDVTHYHECQCDPLDRGYMRKLTKKVIFNNNSACKHVLLNNLESHIKNIDEEKRDKFLTFSLLHSNSVVLNTFRKPNFQWDISS